MGNDPKKQVLRLEITEAAAAHDGYQDTYFSRQNILFLDMNVDFQSDVNRAGLVQVMEFIAEAETPVLIHCVMGQDRSAFICALLECLMGASYEEIHQDYMITYYNFYGVQPGTEQYDRVAKNLDEHLCAAFRADDLSVCDLQKEAEDYFREVGVSEDTLEAVRMNLGA